MNDLTLRGTRARLRNTEIAAIFEEIADLLDIQGANPFRVRAYRNAARTLLSLGREVQTLLVQDADLTVLPGIGRDLAGKIREIAASGDCTLRRELHKQLPASLTELLKIPGLGPRRVKTLYRTLGLHTPEQLRRAARAQRLRALPGFGEKTEARILEALESATGARVKLALAAPYARDLETHIGTVPGVSAVVTAGSFRRMRETVGDLDLVVAATDAKAVMQQLKRYDQVSQVQAQGPTRASLLLRSGLQVDVRVVAAQYFGAALNYFTGSKAHSIALRRLAQERGLKLNEYGVYRGRERIAGDTEESVYRSLGLVYIDPELREDHGEIEAAAAGRLPQLLTLADIKGDLHAHTCATDGRHTLREMASAAAARGLEYLAVTEHSRRLAMAHGLDPQRLHAQIDRIDRLNTELSGVTLLKGIEVDILEDGSLDLPDSVLRRLDLVVAAVHSRFDLPRRRQTERILRAMDRPYFTILAHPSGRLLEQRPPYDVDMLRVVRKARERGCFLELNAHPDRLDLSEVYCRMAKDEGVLVAIGSDAHSAAQFDHLRYGVGQARRGWLEPADVLNTRPLSALFPLLRRTMTAAA